MTERETLIINRLEELIYNGEISNEGMISIINITSQYLGLKTLTNYSKVRKISYQAARKHKLNKLVISDIEFIIDN